MQEVTILSKSEEETLALAKHLAGLLEAGQMITLEGSLGVGKTVFAKGLAEGLGVPGPITSPTFTIIKEYRGKNHPFYHIDAYRLEGSEEDIGFDEYFYSDGIGVVEWAQFIEEDLPKDYLQVNIKYLDEETRELNLRASGEAYQDMIKQLIEKLDEE